MTEDTFAPQIEAVRQQVTALQDHAGESPSPEHGLHPEAVDELRTTLEELQVAEEELRQQNEELAAAREAVEAERQRYQELFEFAPDGYLVTDVEGTIQEANRAAATLLGLSAKFLTGKPLGVFVAGEERQAFRAALTRLRQGGQVSEWTFRLRPRHGAPFDAALTVAAVRDGDGKLVALRWLLHDATEHKQAEENACRLLCEQAARAEAEAANRRKDEFLAMLAHELRNPLAPIRTAIELLKQIGPDEPRLVRVREIIERQVRHQARLLDDLLDVSRISQGKVVLRRERLDLVRMARDTAEDHRRVLEAAGLTLSLELPEEPIGVEGDPTRLAEVLGNLLQNAAKFTNRGGSVTVRLVAEPAGRLATLTVRDTGIGIETELLLHVFETFTQADRSLHRSRGGLGVGLALVKGLVELHGGSVWAHSEGLGRGAEFTLMLPMVLDADVTERRPPLAFVPTGPIRILIVEDNHDAAETLRDLLELFGCTVEVAYSGTEAVAAAPQFRPEVVLCDLGLPGIDGYEVAVTLRRDPAMAHTRLIAMSGYGQEEDQRRSREAGFDLHLTKPVEFVELQRLLAVTPERQQQ
jgi:PAS domain S-box-containing protein